MSIIKSKRRRPESLGYNSWMSMLFGTDTATVAPGTNCYRPLGLNMKFTHMSYVIAGTSPSSIAGILNIASSRIATAPITNTSYGYFDFGGTFAVGDTVTLSVGGTVYKPFVVSAREAGNNTVLARHFTAYLNSVATASANGSVLFSSSWIANSLGVEVVIQPLVYNATAYAYSVTLGTSAGTVTAGGATMVAGTGVQTAFTQPPADQTAIGIVPSGVAASGDRLFPVDIILPTFTAQATGLSGTVYATKNFDAIWGKNTTISLTVANNGPVGNAHLLVELFGVPVDNQPMQPESSNGIFLPSSLTL